MLKAIYSWESGESPPVKAQDLIDMLKAKKLSE
jgi:hypothetical protein